MPIAKICSTLRASPVAVGSCSSEQGNARYAIPPARPSSMAAE
eukprot:CAMPEP_0182591680 /NCGR_PEP_ID=MMETSP1324-20130603/74352_1 /TAXON_ID=236786 /ORGANISM="Florenciella sp., Strain RCC1587" /LENGTH=42 /DNA_ID= /DNA_START= /DNA_END= /DNA_ORIENTATION=